MSSIVADIRGGIETTIAANVSADYQVLKHKFDVTKNDKRRSALAYGVESLEAVRLSGTTNALTLEQRFRITITDEFKNVGHSDAAIQTSIDELNDKIIEISRDLHLSKAGVAGVLVVNP